MKHVLILLSFLMAIHLVACCSYGLIQLSAEELVEKNAQQEVLEKEVPSEHEFAMSFFQFRPANSDSNAHFHDGIKCTHFSNFVEDIQPPPPDFSGNFYQA